MQNTSLTPDRKQNILQYMADVSVLSHAKAMNF